MIGLAIIHNLLNLVSFSKGRHTATELEEGQIRWCRASAKSLHYHIKEAILN
jgi:hypothetical protein